MRKAWLLCCVVGLASAAHAEPLSFSNALERAASDSPLVEARAASVRVAELSVGPADQLPDPQLVLGLENVPVEGPDAYRLDRDEMTMQALGIMQDMPSGAERRARRAMAQAEAGRAEAGLDLARFEARLSAARAWIAVYYAGRRVIAESGGVEQSFDEYAGHHMPADMEFTAAVQFTLQSRDVIMSEDVATVISRSQVHGQFRNQTVHLRMMETVVLRRIDGEWRIVHIHWSSAPITDEHEH